MAMREVNNNRSVIILCAGEARRFYGKRKQLLDLGKHTILQRIIVQCRKRNMFPVVAVRDTVMASMVIKYDALPVFPATRNVTCETVIGMRDYFGPYTSILLGDVVYSPDCVNRIFTDVNDFMCFGNSFEVFGLSFSDRASFDVIAAAHKAKKHGLGKLRYLYKAYMGLDMDCEETEGKPPGGKFTFIGDWTTDVDTQEEFDNLVREVVKKGLLRNI